MRTASFVFLGFLMYTSAALAQEVVEATVVDIEGLRGAINFANGRPPGTIVSISIPDGTVIHGEEILPPITGNVRITGGTFHEALSDGTTTHLFLVDHGGSLQVEGSEFVNWQHAGVGPQAFGNLGELVLKNVVLSSIAGIARVGRFGCMPHQGVIIFNGESGDLRLEGVRISNSGGRVYFCASGPGNGILKNEGQAELVDTHVFLADNEWEVPIFNSGVMNVRDSSFVVLNGSEEPSLSLLFATENAQTEFINSAVAGFKRDGLGLSDGGASGLYFDPNHDGHYVYVLDNDHNTLVVWNTFDVHGNQAWILAIGNLVDGRSLTADAYINENGVLTSEGPVGADRDRFWGTLELELDSCEGGTLSFSSVRADFTSGQFELRRLAFAKQVGCQD